ncbi:MAG TPA: Rid family detoxifying hydrolase [Thermodesulfobacteriota bacterium]|nr:Rid family detoxifying hydrolase [Thermodesulfobacteriota bacterium]
MAIVPVQTDAAPRAIGPYSQAVIAGGFVFASGQIALDPATGQLVPGGVEAQARQVFANLAAVLAAAGSSLARAVKVTVYLTDLAHFAAVNAVYEAAFAGARPARSTVQVAALPRGALIEVDVIALA